MRVRFQGEHYLFVRLSRFIAFCSGLGVAPEQVDDSVLEQFRQALTNSSDVDKPERKVREVIGAWNKLAAMADPPLPILFLAPGQVPRWTIEPEKFSQAFQADVSKWQMELSYVDPEAEEGRVRALRPASVSAYRHLVFKAASALVYSGRSIESITSLRSLVEIEAFRALMKYLRERQGGEPTTALLGVAMTLKSIARNYGRLGDDHVARMRRICANYEIEERVTRTHERLKAFEDEKLLSRLLHLPQALLKEAMNEKTPRRDVKVLAQIALALEIEWQAPFRLKNLNMLRLDENIQPITVGGEPRWIVRFSSGETKNRKPLVFELPSESVRFVERCLRLYEQPDGWLFPGECGGHKDRTLLGRQTKKTVEERLGVPFHVHMMRGLVATMQVKERDGGFEHARAMLGDNSDRVIRKHYTSTAEQHLIRKAQDTIQRVRARTAPHRSFLLIPSARKPPEAPHVPQHRSSQGLPARREVAANRPNPLVRGGLRR